MSGPLADWWDSEIWRHTGYGEYREPSTPESLLADAPESIWPGLMSCEFLPLLSDTAGDWLCVRIGPDGTAEQIVQWYHGGGDWIPWGNSLAEAVLLDAAINRLPGPSRRHAEPAEDPRPKRNAAQRDSIIQWACEHLPLDANEMFDPELDGEALATKLLDAKVAEVAVRCELVVDQIVHPQRDAIQSFGDQKRIDPKSTAQWSFDVDRIPTDVRRQLEGRGVRLEGQQNWIAAAELATPVTESSPELAWAWDICGYAAERVGDVETAVEKYQRAATCSVFTDQSIRLETHWSSDHFAKFAVARLDHLQPDLVFDSEYYQTLKGPDVRQRRMNATEYWLDRAAEMEAQGKDSDANDCLMAAAWDVGVDSITAYASLLDRIAEKSGSIGQAAREELARTHRRCLRERYGS